MNTYLILINEIDNKEPVAAYNGDIHLVREKMVEFISTGYKKQMVVSKFCDGELDARSGTCLDWFSGMDAADIEEKICFLDDACTTISKRDDSGQSYGFAAML